MNNVVFFIIILNMLFLLFYCCSMLLSLSLERCRTVSACPVLLWFASMPYNYLWIGCGILKLYNSSNNMNNKLNNMNNNRTINEQQSDNK